MDRDLELHDKETAKREEDRQEAAFVKRFLAARGHGEPFSEADEQAEIAKEFVERDQKRRQIEDSYLLPLRELQDARLKSALSGRAAKSKSVRARCQWALLARDCGDAEPMRVLSRDFQAGRLRLPRVPEHDLGDAEHPNRRMAEGVGNLIDVVESLVECRLPEANRALGALANPDHPQHALMTCMLVDGYGDYLRSVGTHGAAIGGHPFYIPLLRAELDNDELTGYVYRIKDDSLERMRDREGTSGGIPEELADPSVRRDEAPERVYDVAAERLRCLVGLPDVHPLFKDNAARLDEMKDILDRFQGRFRAATDAEANVIGSFSYKLLIPEISPLGRSATAEDVAKGRAIFELGGPGKVAPLKMPAVGTLKASKTQQNVLILQAEIGADGKAVYGAIGWHILKRISADELIGVRPIEEKSGAK